MREKSRGQDRALRRASIKGEKWQRRCRSRLRNGPRSGRKLGVCYQGSTYAQGQMW